jgi:hypothetical protein
MIPEATIIGAVAARGDGDAVVIAGLNSTDSDGDFSLRSLR